jgi:hypothetical protein
LQQPGNEGSVSFKIRESNDELFIRAYKDGVTFRYELPVSRRNFCDERRIYLISVPDSTMRWLTIFNTANEGLYSTLKDGTEQKDGVIGTFQLTRQSLLVPVHEADLNRKYGGTSSPTSVRILR